MNEWIKVEDRLPNSNVPVIAFVKDAHDAPGRTRRIRAQYAEKFTLPCDEDSNWDDWADYKEPDGEAYCPVGWYETNEFEETHWQVKGTVTHWMPLPDAPTEG
jgi:hypothetical protein